jgi:integrase
MARVYRDPRKRNAVGQPAWCIDYLDAQGVRRRERTEASTKELAQMILRKKLDEIELIKIHGLSAVERVSFNDFLPEYLSHVNAVRTKTAQIRVPSLTKVLARTFGSKVISRIRTGDVQRWVDMRSKEMARGGKNTIKPATVVGEFVCLSAVFREARKRGYVHENPCRGVTLPRVNNKLTRCLTEEQERKLLDASTDCFRPLIQSALYTGMRLGELLDLRWGDVDFETRIVTVVHGKGEKTRHIPMVPELVKVLEQVPRAISSKGEPSPWVFNNPDTATRWVDIKKQWARTLRISAIREFRFHDLRHTFASRLAQRGASLKAIQDLLGHADLKMTMRYAHLAQNNLRDAVSVLSARPKVATRLSPVKKPRKRKLA